VHDAARLRPRSPLPQHLPGQLPDGVCAEPAELDATGLRLRNAQPDPVPDDSDAGSPADTGSDAPLDASAPEAPAGSCTDRTRNGAETDIDCGGGVCPACPLDKGCSQPSDCASGQCLNGACRECAPGSTQCTGTKQSNCMNGLWVVANQDCPSGCDTGTGRCRVCPTATCASVRVIFHGATSAKSDVQLAVDDNKVPKTASDSDPLIGQKTVLFGNFTADKKQYSSDNTVCGLPDYGARTNVYYLAQQDGLAVASSWYASAVDFQDDRYCQSCPNFGCDNFISTPKRIDKIELLAASGDLTCKVCLYRAAPPSDATLIRCVGPNTVLTGPDLDPASKAPALLQLDDGKRCGSY
jgi:hypothetical protein